MPKQVKPVEVPKAEEEEEEEEESEESDSSSSGDSSDDSSDDSSESSDDSSEEEAKLNKAKEVLKTEDKNSKEGDNKVTKGKRSAEELSRDKTAQQPDKKAKQNANAHSNGHSNGVKADKPSSSEVQKWRESNRLTVVNLEDNTNNPRAPYVEFSDAPFPDFIQKSIDDFKFKTPTPIQAQTWPLALEGRDLVGIAETGSGKTLAFGYPAIIHIKGKAKKEVGPKVLVLAPTRELAQQIHEVLVKACVPAGLTACCVFGGVEKGNQIHAIKKADIVIATPGRLIDLIQDGSAQLGRVDYIVFDEADRMLDMGFIPQIRKIVECLPDPAKRQTLMYSATWPVDVQKFAHTYLRSPIQITIGGEKLTGAQRVKQIIEVCSREQEKIPKFKQLLKRLCETEKRPRILVFMLYKHTCDTLYNQLLNENWSVSCLHGGKSQVIRDKAVSDFKKGVCHILIATDVASRGLDIKDIKYVINVEMPLVMEDYIHRIGRTGRAGEEGSAYTLFCPDDKVHARQLVRILEESGQVVPPELTKIAGNAPVTRPRKSTMEQMYGDYAKGADAEFMLRKPTKITFD